MHIKKMFLEKKPVVSFEVFPPNLQKSLDSINKTLGKLSELQPDFISVSYPTLGSSDEKSRTISLASYIKQLKVDPMAHLTCINSTKQEIDDQLSRIKDLGIENVLALRGNTPSGEAEVNIRGPYQYAVDFITEIRANHQFSIGAGCYPEGHLEAQSRTQDLAYLKQKVEAGVDFLITQLFFDNNDFYNFVKEARQLGIKVPIMAGIMPVVNGRQIVKIAAKCGARLPDKFTKIIDRYQDNKQALRDAGLAYASEQIIDLLSSGCDGIHIYTMNRPQTTRRLFNNIKSIVEALKLEESERDAV